MGSTLILGGARSGKSRRALALGEAVGGSVGGAGGGARVFIATAQALDGEMAERIARHRAERDGAWETAEAPLDLAAAIGAACAPGRAVVVDCLTLWLSNMMLAGWDVAAQTAAVVGAARAAPGALILVSNEVGLGLVPETPLGRAFRDAQGRLNQEMAAACDRVEFVAAGLPLVLKAGS